MAQFEPMPWMIELQKRNKLGKRFSRSGSALEDIFTGRTLGEGGIMTEAQRLAKQKVSEEKSLRLEEEDRLNKLKEVIPELKGARDLREFKELLALMKYTKAEKRRTAKKEDEPSPFAEEVETEVGTIQVISPDGQVGTIPADKWREAQTKGYKRK